MIKTWGCGVRSKTMKFATSNGKPVVRINTEMECRYDNVVNEDSEVGECGEIKEDDSSREMKKIMECFRAWCKNENVGNYVTL